MKSFSERNPLVVGLLGVALTAGVVGGSLVYKQLPFVSSGRQYSAYFSEASGLLTGAPVQVSGLRVGDVSSIELDGPRVLIKFKVDKKVRLGDRTEAAIKTKSLLGAKFLAVTPRGDSQLSQTIPLERTRPAYQLPDALGDLSDAIHGLNTDQLNQSLRTLAETFQDTPADLKTAVDGVARLSQTLNARDDNLRALLDYANKATTVLAERTDQVVNLIADAEALLAELETQSAALDQISNNISALAQQVSGLIAENRAPLRPALDKLNRVLEVLDKHKDAVLSSIHTLNQYALSLGESVGAGPYFKGMVVNLLPGQFVQPFVDAAFSDLGLDPNVLLPSQLREPETGQPATPALPVPYPRTGQGGEPRLTLPDAITGRPGDPIYPYREPPPAPPPGGPPPGPPAVPIPPPASIPVYRPAPGEVPPPAASDPLNPAPGVSVPAEAGQ